MKKIISLLASIAMLATMATSVFAAELDNNAPSIDTAIEEMDAATYYETVGAELAAGNKAYVVTADITGLDLSNVRGDGTFNGKKTRTGVGLMSAQYDIVWDSQDNIVEVMAYNDGIGTSNGMLTAFLATALNQAYPTTTDNSATAATATAAHVNTYIVVVKGEVSGTVEGLLSIKAYEKDKEIENGTRNFKKTDVAYTVNGEATDVVTLAVAGGEEGGDEEEKITEVVISDKINVAAEGAIGAAWDVTIKNFDSAKAYTVKFTDGKEVRRDGSLDFSSMVETESDISFVALLNLTQERVNVALDIVVE